MGYLSNYSDLFLEAYVGMAQDAKQSQSIDVTVEVLPPAKKLKAVALKEKVITEHPLYVEVEKMEREILARSLEKTAYDAAFSNWQKEVNIDRPHEYLQNQASSVIESLTKTTGELIKRNALEKNFEKDVFTKRYESALREEKQRINTEYDNKISSKREEYLKDTELLKQKLQSNDVQTRYSITVDLGITPRTSQLKTEDSEDKETKLSIVRQIEEKEIAWQNQLAELNHEREERLLEAEDQIKALLQKELTDLDERYQVLEDNIEGQMAEAAKGVESRRKSMSEAFMQFENHTDNKNKSIVSSLKELQEKQLLDLVQKQENLLKRIERECSQNLRILALKEGYEPGELVSSLPLEAIDLTHSLIELYKQNDEL